MRGLSARLRVAPAYLRVELLISNVDLRRRQHHCPPHPRAGYAQLLATADRRFTAHCLQGSAHDAAVTAPVRHLSARAGQKRPGAAVRRPRAPDSVLAQTQLVGNSPRADYSPGFGFALRPVLDPFSPSDELARPAEPDELPPDEPPERAEPDEPPRGAT